MTPALERAQLVRSVAEALSSDAPIADLWPRCCPLLAALARSERVTIALREPTGDRIAFVFSTVSPAAAPESSLRPGSLPDQVLSSGETIVHGDGERLAVGIPISFGRTLFGAICFDAIAAYDAEDVTLLESCALYAGARLYHESAFASSERYARLAFTDALTGIANRRSFDEALAREWTRASASRTPVGILMLDLDFFKNYNDGYGHQTGDECLQRVATALTQRLKRSTDLVARYGGEEFVALLPDTDLASAIRIAEDLREAIAELSIDHVGCSLGRISVSIGAAADVPLGASGAAQLLHAADDALYRAKLGGRNRVYALGYESESASTRPRRMASRNNLPVALTRLVGRRNEIGQARELLAQHRLVSIVGTGGTGKTRIAIAVAAEIADRFENGAWFVDLSPIVDPTLVASTIGSHFGAHIPMGDGAAEALANEIGGTSALLIIDNCEHLVADIAKLVSALLRDCPRLCVLATSREPLGIAGEAVYRLPLLSLPPPHAMPAAAEAMAYDAIALFVERATEANRTFELDDANVDAVVAICRDVDGIALAIELAASRAGTSGLTTLARRLHDFHSLGAGDRSAAPRQQTMHATIDWSYTLLSEEERALFRRLAIFAGGFTFDSATAVCSAHPVARDDVFDLLSGLVRKSLVSKDPEIEGRYRLLESLRTFARDHLLDAGELGRTARRHAEYFDEFALRADAVFYSTPSREWVGAIEPEIDNLRAALEWTLDERGDLLLGASLASSTHRFFHDVAPGEAVRITRKALDSFPTGAAPEIEARLCRGLAGGARNFPAPVLRTIAERAVTLYRTLDDPAGLAEALRSLAQILGWYFRAERALADELACESIEIARTLDNPLQLALSLRTRGLTIDISDFPQKRAVLEESLALIRRYGSDWQTGNTLTWISDLEFSAGDWPRALEYGREAVSFAERAGSRQLYASSMSNLAAYAGALGDWDTSRYAIERTLATCRKTHQQEVFSFMAQAAAVVAFGTGRAEDAARLIGWCDARVGSIHPTRQADQCEDVCYRKLMKDLRERLGESKLAGLMNEGAELDEERAIALALGV